MEGMTFLVFFELCKLLFVLLRRCSPCGTVGHVSVCLHVLGAAEAEGSGSPLLLSLIEVADRWLLFPSPHL